MHQVKNLLEEESWIILLLDSYISDSWPFYILYDLYSGQFPSIYFSSFFSHLVTSYHSGISLLSPCLFLLSSSPVVLNFARMMNYNMTTVLCVYNTFISWQLFSYYLLWPKQEISEQDGGFKLSISHWLISNSRTVSVTSLKLSYESCGLKLTLSSMATNHTRWTYYVLSMYLVPQNFIGMLHYIINNRSHQSIM